MWKAGSLMLWAAWILPWFDCATETEERSSCNGSQRHHTQIKAEDLGREESIERTVFASGTLRYMACSFAQYDQDAVKSSSNADQCSFSRHIGVTWFPGFVSECGTRRARRKAGSYPTKGPYVYSQSLLLVTGVLGV
ncbi:hypothetical protein A0H81_11643 [Grifola frondosa]|uniref:Secreted protein n=1 Tax=Grifola frondosa TaxID=5627 RepID=A0A1C7LUD7_GRIFR|nr:hypothetical protein A0H81_11643 [Grifola frondosa]